MKPHSDCPVRQKEMLRLRRRELCFELGCAGERLPKHPGSMRLPASRGRLTGSMMVIGVGFWNVRLSTTCGTNIRSHACAASRPGEPGREISLASLGLLGRDGVDNAGTSRLARGTFQSPPRLRCSINSRKQADTGLSPEMVVSPLSSPCQRQDQHAKDRYHVCRILPQTNAVPGE